tara:strand:+ start:1710 stop:1826 length:117 start_codon:yes stop_codon:yes gene_type:complete
MYDKDLQEQMKALESDLNALIDRMRGSGGATFVKCSSR